MNAATDGDRLGDKQEIRSTRDVSDNLCKSDPDNVDTDFGGTHDGDEVRAGSNPCDDMSSPHHPEGLKR